MKRLRVANWWGVNINNKKRKGFTLIELLAVIVILAIIAVIASPIIVGIIEDARKAAFERSVEGIIKATDINFGLQESLDNFTYTIKDGIVGSAISRYEITDFETCKTFMMEEWEYLEEEAISECNNEPNPYDGLTLIEYAKEDSEFANTLVTAGVLKEIRDEVTVSNTNGMNGIIEYDENGKSVFAMHNGKYCVRKTAEMTKPQIIDYEEGNCETMDFTDASCFTYEEGNSGIIITDYTCDITDVVIPKRLNGTNVTEIGEFAFSEKGLTSVVIPATIEKMGERAFSSNQLTGIIDLDKLPNLYHMNFGVFEDNQLSGAIMPRNFIRNDDTYHFNCPFYGNLDDFVARYPDSTVFDWESKICW